MLKLVHSGTPEPADPKKTRLHALLGIKYGQAAERIDAFGAPVEAAISSLRQQGVGRDEAARMLAEHNAALRREHGRA